MPVRPVIVKVFTVALPEYVNWISQAPAPADVAVYPLPLKSEHCNGVGAPNAGVQSTTPEARATHVVATIAELRRVLARRPPRFAGFE